MTDRNLVIENCHVSGTHGGHFNSGFLLAEGIRNLVLKNSTAQENTLAIDQGFGPVRCAGILVTSWVDALVPGTIRTGPIENVIIDNVAVSQNGVSDVGSFSGGIVVRQGLLPNFPVRNIVVQNSIALVNNGTGILVDGATENVVIKNNEADSNNGVGIKVPDSQTLVTKNLVFNSSGNNYEGVPVANIVSGTTAALPNNPLSLLNFSIIK